MGSPSHRGPRRETETNALGEKTLLAGAQSYRPDSAFADAIAPKPRSESSVAAYVPRGTTGTGFASVFGCPTWAGRPISKWCAYGYWNADGTELTVTRVDVKRRAVWLK